MESFFYLGALGDCINCIYGSTGFAPDDNSLLSDQDTN